MNYVLLALVILCVVRLIITDKKLKTTKELLTEANKFLKNEEDRVLEHKDKLYILEQEFLARLKQQAQDNFNAQTNLQKKLEAEFELTKKKVREDAVMKAKAVNKGFDGETFSPFLQAQWNPHDFKHLGEPIDYLILDQAELVRSNLTEEIGTITLLEIKTGHSDMNTVQRRIRDAVVAGRVQFSLYNLDDKTIRSWSPTNPKGK